MNIYLYLYDKNEIFVQCFEDPTCTNGRQLAQDSLESRNFGWMKNVIVCDNENGWNLSSV